MTFSNKKSKRASALLDPAYKVNYAEIFTANTIPVLMLSDKAFAQYQQHPKEIDKDLTRLHRVGASLALPNKDGSVTGYDLSKSYNVMLAKLHIYSWCGFTYGVILGCDAKGGQN